MNEHDIQVIADSQPVLQVSKSARARHERMLTALVDTQGAPASRPPRVSHRVAVIAAAVLGLGAGGVGAATALGAFEQTPSDRSMAYCFATLDMEDEESQLAFVIVLPAPSQDEMSPLGDAAASALESCGRNWSDGTLHDSPPYRTDLDPAGRTHPVPPLVACVLETGQVGVFPGGAGTCTQLQLPTALL